MKHPEKCTIAYCGIQNPENVEELEFEILGLQHAIKKIESKIALLEQSKYIALSAINNSFIYKDSGEQYEFDLDKNSKKESNREEDILNR